MPDMTTQPKPAPVLPPLPVADKMLYESHGHRNRWIVAGVAVPPTAAPYFTEDQMQAYALKTIEAQAVEAAFQATYGRPMDPTSASDAVFRHGYQTALTSQQEVAAEVGDIDVESIRQYLASGLDLGHAVTLGHISEACVHRALVAASRPSVAAGAAGGVDSITVPDGLIECLLGGDQCDEDGTLIIMSRQACHEAAGILTSLKAQPSPHPAVAPTLAACDGGGSKVPLTQEQMMECCPFNGAAPISLFAAGFRAAEAVHGIVEPAPRPDAPTGQINPGSAPREDGHE